MKSKVNRFLFFIVTLLTFATSLFAATYEIDNAHSSVSFKITHLVSTVRGSFDSFKGTIDFDQKAIANSSTSASIDVKTIDTNNPKRDEHLKSADFFEVEKYPQITFTSKKVEEGKMTGDLTMHGVTKEVLLSFTFTGTANDARGNERVGFSATTEIDRKDFGITYNKVLDNGGVMLGDKVKIEIEVEAVKKV